MTPFFTYRRKAYFRRPWMAASDEAQLVSDLIDYESAHERAIWWGEDLADRRSEREAATDKLLMAIDRGDLVTKAELFELMGATQFFVGREV